MCRMRNTLTILSSMPVAAFKTGVEILFYLMLLFYLNRYPSFYVKIPALSHTITRFFNSKNKACKFCLKSCM